jgi:hypothetical protein
MVLESDHPNFACHGNSPSPAIVAQATELGIQVLEKPFSKEDLLNSTNTGHL